MPRQASARTGSNNNNNTMATNGNTLLASTRRFLQRSYAADYVCVVLLAVVYILIQIFVTPFHRLFRLDDTRIQFPHAEVERVPLLQLVIYAVGIPLGVILIWIVLARPSAHKAHVVLLGLLVSHVLTSVITDTIKNAVGRPRPDLISRCNPPADTPVHKLLEWTVCTETSHHKLQDGWRSFPSGHSSSSFAGLVYLSLFLAGQTHALRPRSGLAVVLLTFAPLLGAAMIAISRTEDYRHDVFDVTAGAIIGSLVAWFTYRRFFPGLRQPDCDEAYSKEASGETNRRRIKDEESRIGSRRRAGQHGDRDLEDEMDSDEDRSLLTASRA